MFLLIKNVLVSSANKNNLRVLDEFFYIIDIEQKGYWSYNSLLWYSLHVISFHLNKHSQFQLLVFYYLSSIQTIYRLDLLCQNFQDFVTDYDGQLCQMLWLSLRKHCKQDFLNLLVLLRFLSEYKSQNVFWTYFWKPY